VENSKMRNLFMAVGCFFYFAKIQKMDGSAKKSFAQTSSALSGWPAMMDTG
jgi:hypothetical protein